MGCFFHATEHCSNQKALYLPSGWKLLDLKVNQHKKQRCCKSCFRKISSQIQVCAASSTPKSLLCFIVVPIKSSLFSTSIYGGQTFHYCRPLSSYDRGSKFLPVFCAIFVTPKAVRVFFASGEDISKSLPKYLHISDYLFFCAISWERLVRPHISMSFRWALLQKGAKPISRQVIDPIQFCHPPNFNPPNFNPSFNPTSH